MILTLTLNPALDVSGKVEKLVPDEKSYVHDELHTPGGNGINAALIAHRLGSETLASGFLGGPNGEEIKFLLDREKLPHRFIPIAGKTRMNLTVSNMGNHKQTRLSFPGPVIKKSEFQKLKTSLAQVRQSDIVLIGGSLPPGISAKDLSALIRNLKRKKIFVFVDTPGKILNDVISAHPDFIKPNLLEFQELTGRKVQTIKAILPLARKLNEFVRFVCISSVEGGALLVTRDSAWFAKTPRLQVRSTVGAGDSMVGAMASVLLKKPEAPVDDLLRAGLAASAATLTEHGMILGTRKRIQQFLPHIILRKVD